MASLIRALSADRPRVSSPCRGCWGYAEGGLAPASEGAKNSRGGAEQGHTAAGAALSACWTGARAWIQALTDFLPDTLHFMHESVSQT